jgi:Na+/H+-dicarboxylate symporter
LFQKYFEALATNEILQIVFSIFFGLAAASIGDYVKPVVTALDKMSHIILKMVNYVMNLLQSEFWRLLEFFCS